MIDKKKDISFAEFYLIEFFNLTLSKGVDAIPEENFSILKELSDYLLEEDNVIDGLEKLAQYQGTSEFAIFLFDMIDRIHDFSPFMIYSTVPDLAEDFINLYQLMIEDPESITALNSALALFREARTSKPEAAPKKIEKEIEIEQETDITPEPTVQQDEELLTFDQFYHAEIERQFGDTLALFDLNEKKNEYTQLLNIFKSAGQDPVSNSDKYPEIIRDVAESVNQLHADENEKIQTGELMNSLKYNIKQCVESFRSLEENSADFYLSILETGKLPEISKIKVEEKKAEPAEEKVPKKPLTVDELLHDYFKSEVEDHIGLIRTILNKESEIKSAKKTTDELTNQFKSLKEVSMIHGYSGIEHFCTVLISTLKQAGNDKLFISTETHKVFETIFEELLQVEKFKLSDSDDDQLQKIEALSTGLYESFADSPPILEKIEETSAVQEPKEKLIGFSETKKLAPIVLDLVSLLKNKIDKAGNELNSEELKQLFNTGLSGSYLLFPDLKIKFTEPLLEAYALLDSLKGKEKTKGVKQISKIWNTLLGSKKRPFDLDNTTKAFQKFWELKPEEEAGVFSIADDSQFANALSESFKSYWKKLSSQLAKALSLKDDELIDQFETYFNLLLKSLDEFGFFNYIDLITFIKNQISNGEIRITDELAGEISKTVELTLDRIKAKGRSGDCDDLLAVLHELIQEAPVEAESKEDIPEPEPDEEDVEKIFIQESEQLTKEIKDALFDLEENPDDRSRYTAMENALHSIKSSAHLLNKSKISETAGKIEEAVEIFGKSSITVPAGLNGKLLNSVNDLEALFLDDTKNVEDSVGELQQILDGIVIEDIVEEDIISDESEKESGSMNEKPLFSDETIDEDMLEIFREEAKGFIHTITDSNKILMDKPEDQKALNQLDNSTHSLKSAAKMLGFREIGQIADGIEGIVELINNKQIENSQNVQNRIKEAILVIENLSKGETPNSTEIAKIITLLDFSEQAKSEPKKRIEVKDQDSDDITKVFLEEAAELLQKISDDLIKLEKMPESETILTNLLRNIHTLKGSSMMARNENIGELCHKIEDYFEVYKEQSTEIKEEMLDPVFSAFDLVSELIEAKEAGKGEKDIQFTSKMAEIDNKLFLFQNFNLESDSKPASSRKKKTTTRTAPKVSKEDENIIKITTSYLDNLVNMATELLVNRTELSTYFEDLKKIVHDVEAGKKQLYQAENILEDLVDDSSEDKSKAEEKSGGGKALKAAGVGLQSNFKEIAQKINAVTSELNKLSQGFERNISKIANLSKELHSDILKARMVPIEQLFNRYPRAVRDLAKEQGKQVNLMIEDNDAEMDRAVIESLADPILHIIRNAIDHGIENPKERAEKKKDKKGTITLRASQEKNQIVIDVIDDGRGIDIDSVKKTVVKKKITAKKEVEKLSESEILDYLFLPEFSTKDKATDVSGRGIGLNVVSNQIQKLKGIIRIKTELDAGTTFSIRVPLTLVVSQALMVKSQGQSIAIPVVAVQESVEFNEKDLMIDDERKYVKIRGKLLPYVALDELLTFEGEKKVVSKSKYTLVLHDAGISIALGVQEVIGRQEIVIKSLGDHLQNIDYVSGGTIMGDGQVALILDYAAIIRSVETQFFGRIGEKSAGKRIQKALEATVEKKDIEKKGKTSRSRPKIGKKVISGRKPLILIVDDSISVRNFVGSVVEKQGYATIKSSDGSTAIKRIGKDAVDLMITDLEMPKMHGFELIENIRAMENYVDLPIVILTGKTGQDYRDKAIDLGANAFIMKPFKENDLISVLNDFIEYKQ
jgi:chemotaxis protein histidine kinase CheA/ActR/RegA family two-component response regulator